MPPPPLFSGSMLATSGHHVEGTLAPNLHSGANLVNLMQHIIPSSVSGFIVGNRCDEQICLQSKWNSRMNELYSCAYSVKPPIKDTPKEDKPPNKGQAESTLVYTHIIVITSERGQPLYKKGQNGWS